MLHSAAVGRCRGVTGMGPAAPCAAGHAHGVGRRAVADGVARGARPLAPRPRRVGACTGAPPLWPSLHCSHAARWRAPRAAQPIHAQTDAQGQPPSDGGSGSGAGSSGSGVLSSGIAEAEAAAAAAAAAGADAAAGGSGAAAAAAGAAHDAAAAAAAALPDAVARAASPPQPAAGGKPGSNFAKRVVFGVILGLLGAAIIVYGRLPFLVTTMFVVYQATQEYFGIVTSRGISRGQDAPPPLVSAMTTVLCLSITALTYFAGIKSGTAMCVAAFLLLVMNVVGNNRPTFSQLTSSVFGLFYCGYLPCFWLKLRNLSLPAPEVQLPALAALLPSMSVGLVATFTTVACIIAADTGAYFVGKNLGRTKLTDISPKKTVEGAAGGLASAVAAALALRWLFVWPGDAVAAAGLGVIVFFSSIFGDLIESIMKREAGMKDSGNLIPGHGGLLDRFDSYMFSGVIAWFYITTVLPRFGLA
ncbi:phosphatidate cytidylyltransferase [Raphidocelis subcapitata]|uniref:Phosphatidate cytidylyltransferase n=1 Tax=Raphidocelis subcapitata TaxID=307507 RepID=A0A2V0NTL3_9CHLO|nr:phosphatidate cytidylyltransferase [Raphidocelis subcapitata]|eukprot:GBF90012.1 phosphatidate cytidylyltransferase [Raphidocelis subcapitata]